MTLEQLQQTARDRTEAVIGIDGKRPTKMAKQLTDEYKAAYLAMDEQLKAIHTKFLSGVKPEDYYNEILKFQRLEKLQKQIAAEYNRAARAAGLQQTHISKVAISNTYYQNMYALNWFSGIEQKQFFTVLNPKIIEVSVFGTPEVWKQIKNSQKAALKPYQAKYGTLAEVLQGNRRSDLRRINQAITQSLIQGNSYTKTTKALKDIMNTSANNALRIVRTESGRNMNSGAYANTQAAIDSGVGVGRMAVETLDDRTRAQSAAIDGQITQGLDPFIYPGGLRVDIIGNSGVAKYDINDRGRSIDLVEGLEPDARSGIDPATGEKGIANYQNFGEWADDSGLRVNRFGEIVA
jgi:hypothetical protein